VKAQVAESGKWVCDKCISERLRVLELQDTVQQIDTLTRKNKTPEEQLQLATAGREVGRHDKVQGHPKGGECLLLRDSYHKQCGN